MDNTLRTKFRGCLLGSHVGDCLGGPFEFAPVIQKEISKFLEVSASDSAVKLPKHGAIVYSGRENSKVLRYTDDTEMTLSLARSFVQKKEIDLVDISRRFTEEYFKIQNRNYGAHVVRVFYEWRQNDFSDVLGPARSQFNGSGSYGNGAAMRNSPVTLFSFAMDKRDAVQAVKMCSDITHTHPDGENGAILQHFAANKAIKSDPSTPINPIDFIDSLLVEMKEIESKQHDGNGLYCSALTEMKEVFKSGKYKSMTPMEVANKFGNDEIAPKSVPSAIYCFLRGLEPMDICKSDNPFIRCIHYALSLGGDTDTIAAMAGSICGAYYGESIIPENMAKKCESIEESVYLADELYEHYIATKK